MISRFIIFVALLIQVNAFAQVGLNGQIPTQSGFTRSQLEREVNDQKLPSSPANNISVTASNENSCLATACKMAGTFACDEQDETMSMARACRGNPGDSCIKQVCGNLGEFGCDEFKEVRRIALNCGSGGSESPVGQRLQDSDDRQRLIEF